MGREASGRWTSGKCVGIGCCGRVVTSARLDVGVGSSGGLSVAFGTVGADSGVVVVKALSGANLASTGISESEMAGVGVESGVGSVADMGKLSLI